MFEVVAGQGLCVRLQWGHFWGFSGAFRTGGCWAHCAEPFAKKNILPHENKENAETRAKLDFDWSLCSCQWVRLGAAPVDFAVCYVSFHRSLLWSTRVKPPSLCQIDTRPKRAAAALQPHLSFLWAVGQQHGVLSGAFRGSGCIFEADAGRANWDKRGPVWNRNSGEKTKSILAESVFGCSCAWGIAPVVIGRTKTRTNRKTRTNSEKRKTKTFTQTELTSISFRTCFFILKALFPKKNTLKPGIHPSADSIE